MVKICQTGLLKLNFETSPKKRIFRFLPKISAGHGWSWKFFFADFQILEPLGCQGWVVIPQNVKKSQNRCTLICSHAWNFSHESSRTVLRLHIHPCVGTRWDKRTIFNWDYWSYWEHTITTPPHGHPSPQVLGDGLNYGGVSCDVVGGVSWDTVHGWWRLGAPRWSGCHVCWITRKLLNNKIVLKTSVNLPNSHYDMQSRGFNFRTAMRSRISEMWLIRRRIYRIPELYCNWSGTKDFENSGMWLVQNPGASKSLK